MDAPVTVSDFKVLERADQVQSCVRPQKCRFTDGGPLWRYATRFQIRLTGSRATILSWFFRCRSHDRRVP